MNVNLYLVTSILFLLAASPLRGAAPGAAPNRSSQANPRIATLANGSTEDLTKTIPTLKKQISDLRNNATNHEHEIRTLEETLHTQAQLQQDNTNALKQLHDDFEAQRQTANTTYTSLNSRVEITKQNITTLETLFRGQTDDLRVLKSKLNESIESLKQYNQKIADIEKIIDSQQQQLEHFETALKSMLEAMKMMTTDKQNTLADGLTNGTYQVKPGDTLQKIANKHHISLQTLRQYNQLNDDRIVVNQIIKIP